MENSASYSHLPINSLFELFDRAIAVEDYRKAHAIKVAIEGILLESTISFLPSGDMKITPTFKEMAQYWHGGKIIFMEDVEGLTVDSVKQTIGLLAYERNLETSQIRFEIGKRRKS